MVTPALIWFRLGNSAIVASTVPARSAAVAAPRVRRWLLGLGIFLVIWGARLAVIDQYGSDVPTWDQWSAEGTALILPYEQGHLAWEKFLHSHNEHRILFTRVLAFALFAANRQWDARLECVVNAMLPAALAVGAFFWGCNVLPRRRHIVWLVIAVAMLALPVAWDNVLSGFHSQQHFLMGFSLTGIVLLHARPGSGAWWIGTLCLVCALFAMGSGLLAAAAVAGATLLSTFATPAWRLHVARLLVCGVVVAAGLVLQLTSEVPSPELQAGSLGEFLRAFQRFLVWPFERIYQGPGVSGLAVLLWTPWIWLGWRTARRGNREPANSRAVFAIGLWVLLQIAACAYARGAGAPKPPSRYIDLVVVGMGVNGLALALMLSRIAFVGWRRRALLGGATLATGLAVAGVAVQVTFHFLYRLPKHREFVSTYETTIRTYLASGDAGVLVAPNIPVRDPSTLTEVLSHPEIRAILPASVQPFSHDMGPLSWAARRVAQSAPFVMFMGLAWIVVSLGPDIRRRLRPPPLAFC